jgi:hypothetical protein
MLQTGTRCTLDQPFMVNPNCICFSGDRTVEVANAMGWISRIGRDIYAGPHCLDSKMIVVRLSGSDAYMDI